jgi:signal peptidase II
MGLGLALILGGALGNLWDRIRYEHVIDFIDVYVRNWHWPVFNLADLAVSLGAFLIVWRWMNIKK